MLRRGLAAPPAPGKVAATGFPGSRLSLLFQHLPRCHLGSNHVLLAATLNPPSRPIPTYPAPVGCLADGHSSCHDFLSLTSPVPFPSKWCHLPAIVIQTLVIWTLNLCQGHSRGWDQFLPSALLGRSLHKDLHQMQRECWLAGG